MLTREENELVTRTGPNTPMGDLLRRYWIPALLSSEIGEPDSPPVRIKLLGEKLVAFRDTQGRVGLLEEFCAHRQASLFFGRNEECGLRCVYHGWKYDVDGNCVDMLNEPEELKFKSKIHLTAYPTVEMGGLVWAYMGPADLRPDLPRFDWAQVPLTHSHVSRVWQECNWFQALEGGVDSGHAPILHGALTDTTTHAGIKPGTFLGKGKHSRMDLEITDWGFKSACIRDQGDEGAWVSVLNYIMPFHQIRAANMRGYRTLLPGHIWVPMDDENTMIYHFFYDPDPENEPLTDEDRWDIGTGNEPGDVDPNNNYRPIRNKDNEWMIDRQVQKTETFTGIEGIYTQDYAVQIAMGPVLARSREHLGPTDRPVIALRRMLMQAVKINQDGGNPRGLAPTYYNVRAPQGMVPQGVRWLDQFRGEMDSGQVR